MKKSIRYYKTAVNINPGNIQQLHEMNGSTRRRQDSSKEAKCGYLTNESLTFTVATFLGSVPSSRIWPN